MKRKNKLFVCFCVLLVSFFLTNQENGELKGIGFLLIFIDIVALFLFFIGLVIGKTDSLIEESEKEIAEIKATAELFGIPPHTKEIQFISIPDSSRFCIFKYKSCKIWRKGNELNFYYNKILSTIDLKDVKYFVRVGELEQQKPSSGDIATGFILFGVLGAAMASRESTIDKRQTILVISEKDDQEEFLVLTPESYESLLFIIPEKEFSLIK